MKTIKHLTILASAIALAAGCNTEDIKQGASPEETPVKFEMSIGKSTKTSTDNSGSEGNRAVSWRNGDGTGIFVNDESTAHNYVYDISGDGTWKEASSADAIYAQPNQTYNFYAYYPYASEVVTTSGTTLTAIVQADQNAKFGETENTGFDVSDVLFAMASDISYDNAVSGVKLQYKHAFAMIEVLVSGSDVTAAPAKVTLKDIRPSATIDLVAQSVDTDLEAAKTDVTMCAVADADGTHQGSYLYRAVVPAQTVSGSSRLLEIELAEGTTYSFNAPESGVTYEQSKYRRIEATIGEGAAGLVFPAGSIDEWEPSVGLDPTPGEEKKVDLMEGHYIADLTELETVGNMGSYFTDPNAANYRTATQWGFAKYSSDNADLTAVLENDEDGKYIKLSGSFGSFSYYRSALVYHYIADPETFELGYYKLSFKSKKSEDDTDMSQPIVFVKTSSKDANYSKDGLFFLTKDGAQRQGFTPTSDGWTDFTIYFDFTRASSSAYNANTVTDVTSLDYNELNVVFFPVNSITALYIKDATLIKVTEDEFNSAK